MRPSWRESTWGDEVILNYGKALRNYSSLRGKFRVFGANGPVGWHNEYLSEGPGVILGRKGAYRGVNYSKSPFYVIDTAYFLEPKTPMNMQWLYYNVIYSKLGEIDDGSPIPSTTRAAVYSKKIYVPPYSEQSEIGDFLSKFDDKIELNRKMNETLEQMAQAVFQDWFVDFGPVKRKAKGITDPVAILGGLIPNPAQAQKIAGLFPDQFAENGLPRGWDLKPLTNLASIISGGTPKTSESKYWNGDIPWYSIVDAPKSGEVFVLDTQKHITIEGLNNSAARLIRPNVTIISARGTVGKLAIADHAMCFNQSCYGIEANNCINDYFIYLNLIHALNRLQNMAYGTVFSTITRKTIEKVFINIPSNDLLISFSTCVDPLFNLIKHNGEQIRTLAEMRDLLLPKLMSGEISVDELEKKMGGVL